MSKDTGPDADNTPEALQEIMDVAHAILRLMDIRAEATGMSDFNQGRALRHAMAHHLIENVTPAGWPHMAQSVVKHAHEMIGEPVKDEIGPCAGSA